MSDKKLGPEENPQPPEPPVAGRCQRCRAPLSRGELVFEYRGRIVCSDCLDDRLAALSRLETARLLGYRAREAGD